MTSEAMRNGNKHILKIYYFQKGHPEQKGRCPDTLDTTPRSAPASVNLVKCLLFYSLLLVTLYYGDTIASFSSYTLNMLQRIFKIIPPIRRRKSKSISTYAPGVATVTVRMKALMHHMQVFSLGNHFFGLLKVSLSRLPKLSQLQTTPKNKDIFARKHKNTANILSSVIIHCSKLSCM